MFRGDYYEFKSEDLLGPAYYYPEKAKSKIYGSGERSGRNDLFKVAETPPPGHYDVYYGESVKNYSKRRKQNHQFASKTLQQRLANETDSPGPIYNTRKDKRSKSTISRPVRYKQDDFLGKKASESPSPDSYSVNVAYNIRGGYIGQQSSSTRNENYPGPGYYNVDMYKKESFNINFNNKLKTKVLLSARR